MVTVKTLSPGAIDVLEQLFVYGPTWDGNLVSKSGRTELISVGLADQLSGWTFLNGDGVRTAVDWESKARRDSRWYQKAKNFK